MQPAAIERGDESALGLDLLEHVPGPLAQLGGKMLDQIGPAERVGHCGEVHLVLEDLLDAHRHLMGVLRGN